MVDIRDLPFPIVVTEVHALGEFQLALTFKDGKQGIFDMKPYLGKGVFKDLENQGYFSLVTIENSCGSPGCYPTFLTFATRPTPAAHPSFITPHLHHTWFAFPGYMVNNGTERTVHGLLS